MQVGALFHTRMDFPVYETKSQEYADPTEFTKFLYIVMSDITHFKIKFNILHQNEHYRSKYIFPQHVTQVQINFISSICGT